MFDSFARGNNTVTTIAESPALSNNLFVTPGVMARRGKVLTWTTKCGHAWLVMV
jgi:hypothetical protein